MPLSRGLPPLSLPPSVVFPRVHARAAAVTDVAARVLSCISMFAEVGDIGRRGVDGS